MMLKTAFRTALMLLSIYSMSAVYAADSTAGTEQNVEQEVMAVLDAFMATFNARDPVAHTATYQFPHFRLANGEMHIWQTREEAIKVHELNFPRLRASGWYRSVWLDREVIGISDTKVHVATRFRRLREDGSEIVTAESLYVLTFEGGRWGIKLRSSYL